MKYTQFSLALLGLPAALAAVVITSDPTTPHDHLRRVAPPPTDSASASGGSLTVDNSYTHPSSATSSPSPTEAAAGGSITQLAVFTAGGGIYTVTSLSGAEAVDGKPLSLGGPAAFIAGEYVSQASSGIVADGQTIAFETYSASSSMAVNPMTMSTSAAASGSGSAAAAPATGSASGAAVVSTSGSAGAAAPRQTGGVAAVLGVVVGALVL